MHYCFYLGPTPREQEAHELPRFGFDDLDGLDPDDPAAVDDAMKYLQQQGIECTRKQVQDFLRKLKEGLLRKLQNGAPGAND